MTLKHICVKQRACFLSTLLSGAEEDGDDSAFENLSNNNDFVDVTLACEDGQHWEEQTLAEDAH